MPNRASRLLLLALLMPSLAIATEVEFEGAYRARARLFDSLSLERTIDEAEGLSMYMQHRLWLRPKFLLSDRVALTVDFKGLDGVTWGDRAITPTGVVPGAAPTYQYDLTAPVDDPSAPDADGTNALQDFTLWHAWGEVHTGIGQFRFGRMPLHWGSGIWLNDGLTVNPHFSDGGDTADRIQWDYLVVDQFVVRLAVDTNAERFVNLVDDTTAFNAALAYQSETVSAGIHSQLQHTVNSGLEAGRFNLFTIDLAASAEMGKLSLSTETVGQFGAGDLTDDLDEINVAAMGSVLSARLSLDPWGARVEAGLASGDGSLGDQSLRTFTFDSDYSVGLMLFEQPMPTLAAALGTPANANRSFDEALTGNAISNALYLKPSVLFHPFDDLETSLAWLGARTAKIPEAYGDRNSYGMEFQLGARYTGIEHVDVGLLLGSFLPGSYYENLPDDEYPEFIAPAYGIQLSTRIHF